MQSKFKVKNEKKHTQVISGTFNCKYLVYPATFLAYNKVLKFFSSA